MSDIILYIGRKNDIVMGQTSLHCPFGSCHSCNDSGLTKIIPVAQTSPIKNLDGSQHHVQLNYFLGSNPISCVTTRKMM
jgi:hypothetical protein